MRRNNKYSDLDLSLIMDILTQPGSEWRTVLHKDAKATLKKSRERQGSISGNELDDLVDIDPAGRKRWRTIIASSESDMDNKNNVTIVENETNNDNTNAKNCPRFTFINTNAHPIKPKLEALNDCFVTKDLDLHCYLERRFIPA